MLAIIASGFQKGYASHVIFIPNITGKYCKLNAILRQYFCIYSAFIWIFENGVKELNSRLKRAFFFLAVCKGDDIKIKRKFSFSFFLHLFIFLSLPSLLYFALFHCLEAVFRSSEIKVKYG